MEAIWALVGAVVAGFGVFAAFRGRERLLAAEKARLEEERARLDAALRTAEIQAATLGERAARLPEVESTLRELEAERDRLDSELKAYEQRMAVQIAEIAKEREHQALERTEFEREKQEQKQLLVQAQEALKDTFKSLSGEVLKTSNEQFLSQAEEVLKRYKQTAEGDSEERKKAVETLLTPIQERLKELDSQNQEMERRRSGAYQGLKEQIDSLLQEQKTLRGETGKLVRALQDPGSAGQWGEMVLKRVIEMAGLNEHVDFSLQETQSDGDQRQRPDCVVRMVGDRRLYIDSKAPMKNYLDALSESHPEQAQKLLAVHAQHMLDHAKALGRREYHAKSQDAADFTVMFIGSESAFRAANEARPTLVEDAMQFSVIMATPSTLLALLKSVAYGWRQETLAKSARILQEEGRKLYEAVCTLFEHYDKLGKALSGAGKAFNELGGSLNARVLPSGRRMRELGVESAKELGDVSPVEFAPRVLTAKERSASGAQLGLLPEADGEATTGTV